ncbi:uncharacterized protein LOC128681691 [Plodia interpunctella]|uniref:uncharacterized protein LOC128681691 n=1 Tax=Plodia interpunctella TaxID=58824 RepID=UPI002368A620|nr:uncharacterized protein LOC128681691 [Plodia interpunctella]
MTLYSIFIISFILFYSNTIETMKNINLATHLYLDTIFPSGTGLIFVFTVNNSAEDDANVELSGDRCCLSIGSDNKCDLLEVIGTCIERIPRGTAKTMRLVAPILDPFERVGHCWFNLDSKSSRKRKKTMRNRLKINFDTKIDNKDQAMIIPRNVRNCDEIDEDPLNDCQFVDCDTYYNGKKPYFNKKSRKCTETPECVYNDDETQMVLDTVSNKCLETDLKKEDLDFIKHLIDIKQRTSKDIIIIKNPNTATTHRTYKPIKYHGTTKYKNIFKLLTLPTEQTVTHRTTTTKDLADYHMNAKDNLNLVLHEASIKLTCLNNLFKRLSVHILAFIILVQCCCIVAMICLIPKPCTCANKKVVKNFLNYRQDVSVTTPLIDTSNMDTETTNYTSESNVDKKIRCYKACQKEVNVQMSLSDDILSKCITRRDWHSKHLKYTPDKHKTKSDICKIQEKSEHEDDSNVAEEKVKNVVNNKVLIKKETDSKERERKSALRKSIFRKLETKSDSGEGSPKCGSSEKEISSHFYTEELKDSFTCTDNTKICEGFKPNDAQKHAYSMSTEKGAQVEFSNDSIDDFLSERGMIYVAGDNMSKFSFSSSSEAKPTSHSTGTSKTSKNNLVKNIFSIFRKNSKVGPLSDPGAKKSGLNVELLHMSHASIYSSSNNGSEYFRCLKKMKDSRTSL